MKNISFFKKFSILLLSLLIVGSFLFPNFIKADSVYQWPSSPFNLNGMVIELLDRPTECPLTNLGAFSVSNNASFIDQPSAQKYRVDSEGSYTYIGGIVGSQYNIPVILPLSSNKQINPSHITFRASGSSNKDFAIYINSDLVLDYDRYRDLGVFLRVNHDYVPSASFYNWLKTWGILLSDPSGQSSFDSSKIPVPQVRWTQTGLSVLYPSNPSIYDTFTIVMNGSILSQVSVSPGSNERTITTLFSSFPNLSVNSSLYCYFSYRGYDGQITYFDGVDPSAPVQPILPTDPSIIQTITFYFDKISFWFSSFTYSVSNLINDAINGVTTLVNYVLTFTNSVGQLYQWIPNPILTIITAMFSLLVVVIAINSFRR